MAHSILVAWRDAHHQGLDGVVEIRSSDFAEGRYEDASVRDFIELANKKVQEATADAGIVHEVKQVMLHGVRVSSGYPLEYIIPELMGSSPRLVATMKTRPGSINETFMVVFVKALSGRTVAFACTPTDTVGYIKCRIEDEEGIPPEHQRLMHAGRDLQDHLPLSFYNIRDYSTLYSTARLLGGFTGPMCDARTFADVSDGSIITADSFSPDAPEWRLCSKGLNIEGRCMNHGCRAYRCMVIVEKKFQLFNLVLDDDIRCPMCRVRVAPITCGLYDCCWRYEGVKADTGMFVSSPWEEARGYVYHRFNADETQGCIGWANLVILVKAMDEATAARLTCSTLHVNRGDTCSICWSPFGSPIKRLTAAAKCGHTFHRVCTEKWSRQCQDNKTHPSCPICRRTL